jgi:hypothetical protein
VKTGSTILFQIKSAESNTRKTVYSVGPAHNFVGVINKLTE